ncbi:MAG: MBOAT family protein, partial [Deltaproteobacteria bacterium]|nr:MBOAT family protein [Deltaproteobacteria bacterium]
MPFTSLDFALFFGIVLILNWRLRKNQRFYPIALLVFNLVFYSLGAPKFLPLLFIVAFLNWNAASLLGPSRTPFFRRFIITVNVVLNLSILGFFKYFDFILESLEELGISLHGGLFSLPEIIYPVGLSFFTFQGLSLAIDKYRDPDLKTPSFLETFVFVSFFPTVLSGPIQRFENFLPQLKKAVSSQNDYSLAITLIITGLFKKVALSSYLSEYAVRGVFQMPDQYSFLGVLGAVYSYSAQIYLDFSGYSDLAQGVGLLLGFNVGVNFESPYLSTNIRDFWRRWHISLSSWLRDYLYFSLGGSRKGSTSLNLIITQTLGGLWHGAHLRYLIWGVCHGFLLAITHAFISRRKRREAALDALNFKSWQRPVKRFVHLKKFLAFFLTFNAVSLLWILFRADTMKRAWEVFTGLFDFNRGGEGAPILCWIIILITFFGQWAGKEIKELLTLFQSRLSLPALSLWCAFWVIIIL